MLCAPKTALVEFALPSPQMRYYSHLAIALDLLYEVKARVGARGEVEGRARMLP